jgi:hypothetical protein
MPQYSNTAPAKGFTVTSVLNTDTATVTFTVTAPTGQTATTTTPSPYDGASGDIVKTIGEQFTSQGVSLKGNLIALGRSISETGFNTLREAEDAARIAKATNTTVPAAPNPPPPASNATDPAVPAPTAQTSSLPVSTTAPTPVAGDELAVQERAAANQVETTAPAPVAGDELAAQERAAANQVQTTAPSPVTNQDPVAALGGGNLSPEQIDQKIEDVDQKLFSAKTKADNLQVEIDRLIERNNPDQAATLQAFQASLANARNSIIPSLEAELSALKDQKTAAEAAAANATKAPAPVDDPGTPTPSPTPPAQTDNATLVGQSQAAGATRALTNTAKIQNTQNDRVNLPSSADWRVRLSLANSATYLYRDTANAGILAPLAKTNGVVFPYTPSIETSYQAKYDTVDLTHSNYRGYFYRNSSVDTLSIRGTFTAQDTREAEYLLAVIAFFRSVTKMFYGQGPFVGTPPPLVFLSGLGQYQFNNNPCVVSNFQYSLPPDVDYIRANGFNNYGINLDNRRQQSSGPPATGVLGAINQVSRLANNFLSPGALPQNNTRVNPVSQNNSKTNYTNSTYVPTKMEINITLLPIQTRSQVSSQFDLQKFAAGQLLQGGFW